MFFYCRVTSLASIALTQTSEGWSWLQNYTYAKTGNTESSVGVGLLKLLTLNWDKLNNNQKNWCKEYLPFLLQNYRDYGANALYASDRSSSISLNWVKLYWDGSQKCVNGHQFNDWQYKYSDDMSQVVLSHTCKTCGVDETEVIKAHIHEDDTSVTYTYTPVKLASEHNAWTKNVSKSLGSGTETFYKGSDGTDGVWSAVVKSNPVGHDHIYRGGNTYNTISRSQALLNQTASLKSGYIKPNVSSINVSLPGDSSVTVSLRTAKGKELKSVTVSSGTKNIIIDCSDISKDDLTNCYLTVAYTKIIEKNSAGGTGWSDYPPYPSFEIEGHINSISVIY